MGMFDYINYRDKLPVTQEMIDIGLTLIDHDFQTKDLDCFLDLFVIENGKLYRKMYEVEEWVEGDPKEDDLLSKLGHLHRDKPYFKEVEFHGEIRFYDGIHDVKGEWDCWVEFLATFTDGKLTKIDLLEFRKESNKARKELEQYNMAEQRRFDSIWYNKYIFRTNPWRWFRRKYVGVMCRLSAWIQKMAFKLP